MARPELTHPQPFLYVFNEKKNKFSHFVVVGRYFERNPKLEVRAPRGEWEVQAAHNYPSADGTKLRVKMKRLVDPNIAEGKIDNLEQITIVVTNDDGESNEATANYQPIDDPD